MLPISVLVLTKNSAKNLSACLSSVVDFSEVVVYDSGSSDGSETVARDFKNVKFILDSEWAGFGVQRQKALAQCRSEWVLWLDSDESVSQELHDELHALDLSQTKRVYRIQRRNHFGRKVIVGTDWSRDWVYRLFAKKEVGFDSAPVHEKLDFGKNKNLELLRLQGKIEHFPYEGISDFFVKMDRYTDLAKKDIPDNVSRSCFVAWTHGAWTFFRNYFLRMGFRDGFEGFVISYFNGVNSTLKRLKWIEQKNSEGNTAR